MRQDDQRAVFEEQRVAAAITLVVVTALYVGLGWVNERLAVNLLKGERARVAALYDELEA